MLEMHVLFGVKLNKITWSLNIMNKKAPLEKVCHLKTCNHAPSHFITFPRASNRWYEECSFQLLLCNNVLLRWLPGFLFFTVILQDFWAQISSRQKFVEATKTSLSDILKCYYNLPKNGNIKHATSVNTGLLHKYFISF